MDKIADIASLIVVAAIVSTLVAHKNTATVVNSIGDAFSGSIRAAIGTPVAPTV